MIMKYIKIMMSLSLLLVGCQKSSNKIDDFEKNQNPYFPLKKGNSWTYYDPSHIDDSLTIKVEDYVNYDDKVYAEVVYAYYRKGSKRNNYTRYCSYGDSGKIILKNNLTDISTIKDNSKWIYYDTMKEPGTDWYLSLLEASHVCLEAKYDSISINNKKYFDCIRYFVSTLEWERNEYLVKNIGLVHISPYEISRYDLK